MLKKSAATISQGNVGVNRALEEESLAGQTGSCMKIAVGY
jgi:hypothetical protein